jgi:hypothetical protein
VVENRLLVSRAALRLSSSTMSTSVETTPRLRQRLPYWLALAAMLLQIISNYGHFHGEDYRFLARGHGGLVVVASHGTLDPSGAVLPDNDCAICAAAQLLGNAAVPAMPVLGVPQFASFVAFGIHVAFWLAPPPHFLFASRAPPSI